MMNKYSESFDSALAAAQEKGYAERDPSDDINGIDTCRKICILADIAFGYGMDSTAVYAEGITAIRNKDVALAEKLDSSIKLLGRARKEGDRISVMVAPFVVSRERVIAGIDDVFNAVAFNGNAVGEVTLCGRGAGMLPTASAMVADIVDVVNNGGWNVSWCNPTETPKDVLLKPEEVEDKYYVAFSAADTNAAKDIIESKMDVKVLAIDTAEIAVETPKMPYGDLKKILSALDEEAVRAVSTIRIF